MCGRLEIVYRNNSWIFIIFHLTCIFSFSFLQILFFYNFKIFLALNPAIAGLRAVSNLTLKTHNY
jgi:hypothetical protein